MTAKLFTLNPVEGYRPKTFAGHKDHVLGAFFSAEGRTVCEGSFILPSIKRLLSVLALRYIQSAGMARSLHGGRNVRLIWKTMAATMKRLIHPAIL